MLRLVLAPVQARAASAASRLAVELQAVQKRQRDTDGDVAAANATAAFHQETCESMKAELTDLRRRVARQRAEADTAGAAVGMCLACFCLHCCHNARAALQRS